MTNNIYIPINSNSLAHYFGKAIILPAKYFLNKPEDIQNNFNDSILLSKSKWVKNADCSIEVILTGQEIKLLNKISENFFELNIPIPVSRIKRVYFLDSKQKETTLWNINNGAAFVPESIIQIEQNKNIDFHSTDGISNSKQPLSNNELAEKIKRFDILLGGFAFMRIGGKSGMNFSENYFSTLSFFNKLIEEQTTKASREKGLKFSNKYIGLFSKNDSEWTKWQNYIYQNVEAQDVENIANKEGIRFEKKLGLIKLDSISPTTHLFDIAILATYGDRKTKSIDNLVTDLANGIIPQEKAEDVSLLFGLNNGYSKFRNKYKTANKESNVKFKLESKLDYYIIESLYQFAFNGNKSNYSFSYIDDWCTTLNQKETVSGFETFKILDTVVIAKKKQTPLEDFLQNTSADIYTSLNKSVCEWLPPFAMINEKEALAFFEKVLKSPLTVAIEKFQKSVEKEYEVNLDNEKSELLMMLDVERKKLNAEIENLKEQILNLENSKQIIEEKNLKGATLQIEDTKKLIIQEPEGLNDVAKTHEKPIVYYESMGITELKKIAKQKGINESVLKEYTKKNIKSLIDLIKNSTSILLL